MVGRVCSISPVHHLWIRVHAGVRGRPRDHAQNHQLPAAGVCVFVRFAVRATLAAAGRPVFEPQGLRSAAATDR